MARAKRAELGAELARSLMDPDRPGVPADVSVQAGPPGSPPPPTVEVTDIESDYPTELPGLDEPFEQPPNGWEGGGLAESLAENPLDLQPRTPLALREEARAQADQPETRVNPGSLGTRTPRFGHVVAGEIRPDFRRIVETLFATDAFATYEDLERNLEVGEDRANRRTLQEHLDKAESRARLAHKLYASSKLELVSWEADDRRTMSALREKARLALEEEKAKGERTKRIAIADVDDWMAENYFDEWKARQVTRAALKEAVESLEHLVKRWDSKCVDLRTLLETLR